MKPIRWLTVLLLSATAPLVPLAGQSKGWVWHREVDAFSGETNFGITVRSVEGNATLSVICWRQTFAVSLDTEGVGIFNYEQDSAGIHYVDLETRLDDGASDTTRWRFNTKSRTMALLWGEEGRRMAAELVTATRYRVELNMLSETPTATFLIPNRRLVQRVLDRPCGEAR